MQRLSRTGSLGCDRSGGQIYWSCETFRIFGYEPAPQVSIDIVVQRTHPDDGSAVQQLIERVSREQKEWAGKRRGPPLIREVGLGEKAWPRRCRPRDRSYNRCVGDILRVHSAFDRDRLMGEIIDYLRRISQFGIAFYHSAVNYTTLGYGDIIMTPSWRFLGSLEAADGALMFGVSTAMIDAVIATLMQAHFEDLRN